MYSKGQELIRSYMTQAGMTVMQDSIGNVTGLYKGTNKQLAPVMMGSHLDTVPGGGAFDGALGIITAIECIHLWNQAGWRPERTVKVIAMIEEEGTLFGMACFGSRALAGEFSVARQKEVVDSNGRALADYLADMGLGREFYVDRDSDPTQLHCFFELHVEQGAELEIAGVPLGVVTGIVGIDRIGVRVGGEANHAGTTRMDRRKDALVAAASLISYIRDKALAANGRYVATIGKLDVYPMQRTLSRAKSI
jgi:allantoate deiminase/N-carbamoyl-L-amino-acid hydrolase